MLLYNSIYLSISISIDLYIYISIYIYTYIEQIMMGTGSTYKTSMLVVLVSATAFFGDHFFNVTSMCYRKYYI